MKKILVTATLLIASMAAHADGQIQSSLYQFQLRMAQQGNPEAEYLVGQMNEEGRGTTKNVVQAITWYKKAAAQGNTDADKRLANLQNPTMR